MVESRSSVHIIDQRRKRLAEFRRELDQINREIPELEISSTFRQIAFRGLGTSALQAASDNQHQDAMRLTYLLERKEKLEAMIRPKGLHARHRITYIAAKVFSGIRGVFYRRPSIPTQSGESAEPAIDTSSLGTAQ